MPESRFFEVFFVFLLANSVFGSEIGHVRPKTKLYQPMPVLLKPRICPKNTETILAIHSSVANFERRHAIRATFGAERQRKTFGYAVLFVAGRKAGNPLFDKWIAEEADEYGDILQGDFIDTYENITIKGLLWMRHVASECPGTRFVLHLDDDVIVNLPVVFDQLLRINDSLADRAVLCLATHYTGSQIIREPSRRWFVSYTAFPEPYYPIYCAGAAYLLPASYLSNMVAEIEKIEYIPIDDVVITGIARRALGLDIYQVYPEGLLRKDEDTVFEAFQRGEAVVGECLSIQCILHLSLLIDSNTSSPVVLKPLILRYSSESLLSISTLVLASIFLLLAFIFAFRFFKCRRKIRLKRIRISPRKRPFS